MNKENRNILLRSIFVMAIIFSTILPYLPYTETLTLVSEVSAKKGNRPDLGIGVKGAMENSTNAPTGVTITEGPWHFTGDKIYDIYGKNFKSDDAAANAKKEQLLKTYLRHSQLPYTASDGAGNTYPAYCGQSKQGAVVQGKGSLGLTQSVVDAKYLKLMQYAAKDPANPTEHEKVATQLLIWAAQNSNWDPKLFSHGMIELRPEFYDAGSETLEALKNVSNHWGEIISAGSQHVKPLEVKDVVVKIKCNQKGEGAIAEIDWGALGGGSATNLQAIADLTYSGTGTSNPVMSAEEVKSQLDLSDFGMTAKSSADYIYFDKPFTEKGGTIVTVDVDYKDSHSMYNDFTLARYDTGNSQPFFVPVPPKKQFNIIIEWGPCDDICPPGDPECEEEEEEEEEDDGGSSSSCPQGSFSSSYEDLTWYNMPSAFGEFKDGSGFNNNGETTQGSYTPSRSGEEFEAMNGVPTTERFYVNLGGTEGFMYVTYSLEKMTQEFIVCWETPYTGIPLVCPGGVWTGHTQKYTWDFVALHIKEASFRVFDDGQAGQDELHLELNIVNSDSRDGSYKLWPNPEGLEIGPGTDSSKTNLNFGATKSWAPSQGVFTTQTQYGCRPVADKPAGWDEAHQRANNNVGEIFAQNDALEITIQDDTYVFVPNPNPKSSLAFPGSGSGGKLDATDGEEELHFNPIKEKWDVWDEVPIAGYNGNPGYDADRNSKGTPLIVEHIPVPIHSYNGIYEWQQSEMGNLLHYSDATVIRERAHDIQRDVGSLLPSPESYGSAKNPTNQSYYNNGNSILLQYTNWQVPVSVGTRRGQSFSHSGNEPDMNKDNTLGDNPTYRSINPILLHNPTTALYSWISDIPFEQLADQRIESSKETFETHNSVDPYETGKQVDERAVSRQYIDYDFQLTIPNAATFNKYWSQKAGNSEATGIEDLDFTNPGTLGKNYKGNAADQHMVRQYENPYLDESDIWDVSKWITAKYVKFPYDVYYYKNSGEQGGDVAGFYNAGEWIKLYDNHYTVDMADPTEFNFHIASEQKDIKDGTVYVAVEALNSADEVKGDPEKLYASGEQYVNGTRNPEGTNIGNQFSNYATTRDGEAMYSAVNQFNVDAIGRIGNLLVSDVTDPAWSSVFWETDNRNRVITGIETAKDYGVGHNMYDSKLLANATGFDAYNRYKTLDNWHNQMDPLLPLPLTTNVLTKGKEDQTVKLGYEIGGSLQTVGDYDYDMWVFPRNKLAGKFATGNTEDHFKLITSDPFMPGASYQEYYDSNVNNSPNSYLGNYYSPKYEHIISSSLADPRMKMSAWERSSTTYQTAVQLGSNTKTKLGTPSFMNITTPLRTLIGRDETQGKWGLPNENGNNGSGSKDQESAADCNCAKENVQKWNWNYSLPQNTQIWFDNNSLSTRPKFEAATRDQYIITSMAFRTKTNRQTFPGISDDPDYQLEVIKPGIEYGDSYLVYNPQSVPDWDLTMFTNTGQNRKPADETTNKPRYTGTGGIIPHESVQPGHPDIPMIDIVWWNYSKQSTTDKDNVGTH